MTTIITVATARRTLGKLAKDMTDEQVQELINTLHLLARDEMLYNGSKVERKSNLTNADDN